DRHQYTGSSGNHRVHFLPTVKLGLGRNIHMKPHELEREFQKELDIILPEGEYILPPFHKAPPVEDYANKRNHGKDDRHNAMNQTCSPVSAKYNCQKVPPGIHKQE